MIGNDSQLFQKVLNSVEYWIPAKEYGHENKFQNELQEFLDDDLNSSAGRMGMDAGLDQSDHVVTKEHGKSKGDVVVDDVIGIELKRNLSNSQTKKLRGQIESYLDNYRYVIVCACGIDDRDGWRDLKNKYEGSRGLGMDAGEVAFVHKKKENFGNGPDDGGDSGGFLDGGLF